CGPHLLTCCFFFLPANNYLESKCEAIFQEMRRCCARYPKGRSTSCSGFQSEKKEKEISAIKCCSLTVIRLE
uniref:Cx9C motif-containing protein 4 n=1 Tax=Varanus komodoensis TaxID=61221 RepID=A0A8D2LIA7_VARKO